MKLQNSYYYSIFFILSYLLIPTNSQITVLGPTTIIEKVKELEDGSMYNINKYNLILIINFINRNKIFFR